MWRPVGPLPAAVYWRRRGTALASATMLVALVMATVTAPVTAPLPGPVPAANRAPASTPPAPGPAAARPPVAAAEGSRDTSTAATTPAATSTAATSTGPKSTNATSTGPTSTTTPARPTRSDPLSAAAAPDTGTERIRPDDTPRPSVAAPATPVPSSGPIPCTNAMLTAAAELEHAVHRVGSHPVLRLVITNVSGQPCVRDLDSARQEIVVWSQDGATRLWSSNDCLNASSIDLRTLVPGRPVVFAVTWGERTTTPGCRTPRTPVPAGTYRLMVRLDDLISPPTPFIRTA